MIEGQHTAQCPLVIAPYGLASQTHQHDPNNRLSQRNSTPLSYDDNGNLLSDGSRSYTWNARNQLIQVQGPDNLSYQYDPLGRRHTVTRNGQSQTTLHDGWNPIQLKNATSVLENRLIGPGLDQHHARTHSGQTETYLTDPQGSTLQLRNASGGLTVAYRYDPYGQTTASAPSSNRYTYTGREQDSGPLYYYRNRYYHAELQRFISEDPIGRAGGDNLYGYVGNDPVGLVDPLGLAPRTEGRIKCENYCASSGEGVLFYVPIMPGYGWCFCGGKCPPKGRKIPSSDLQAPPNRLVKNPSLFPLTHACRDFLRQNQSLKPSFSSFPLDLRAFPVPEAVVGRYSGALRPRWAWPTRVWA